MEELKLHRNYKDKFTVTTAFEDYGAFAYEGVFPTIRMYFRVDTEEELLTELKKEDGLIASEVASIFYAGENVTKKYLGEEHYAV